MREPQHSQVSTSAGADVLVLAISEACPELVEWAE